MKELTHEEINKSVASLAGDAEVKGFNSWVFPNGSVIDIPISYTEDLGSALNAARRISDKTGYTFVLTFDGKSSEWTASFGDYLDCAEYRGGNPAYCICISILKFYGKV